MEKFVKRLAIAGAMYGILNFGYRFGQGYMLGILSGFGKLSDEAEREVTQALRDAGTLGCKFVRWVANQEKKRITEREQES